MFKLDINGQEKIKLYFENMHKQKEGKKMKKTLLKMVLSVLVVLGISLLAPKVEAKTVLGDYLNDKGIEVEVSATIDFYDKY